MRALQVLSSMRRRGNSGSRQRGSAVIEISLLAPWVLFLFVGVFDMGFYTYSMIGVENAARVAAEYTSKGLNFAGDTTDACNIVLAEMTGMPNVGTQANCNASTSTNNVIVTAGSVQGPDSKPATQVTVTYKGQSLIPIPGLLIGQLNITRTLEMRVKP